MVVEPLIPQPFTDVQVIEQQAEAFSDDTLGHPTGSLATDHKRNMRRSSILEVAKAFRESENLAIFQRKASKVFQYAETENSALFEMGDDCVDPLMWDGTMGWRWYTGFLIYLLMMVSAPLIGFVAFNILQMRSTMDEPTYWWKCGVFCAFVWSLILFAFTFTVIRTLVRCNQLYVDFNPSWARFIFIYLTCGVIMLSFWCSVYFAFGGLVWIHGVWAALFGLSVGPSVQCFWITPELYTRKERLELLIITLAISLLFLPVQVMCLYFCLVIYIYTKRHLLALFPFYIVRVVADMLVEKVCYYGRASSLRIVFININALINRLILCWALSSEFNVMVIMVTVIIDFLIVISFSFLVSGPLSIHVDSRSTPRAFVNWMLGKTDDSDERMDEKLKKHASCERAKWVYFTVLHSNGEVIMPWWQMFFYYLLNSTETRNAISGFEKTVNGFPLIDSHNLLQTAMIIGMFDVLDFMLFTYIVRRKFPHFTPFRLLNVMVKKYNTLLALSVMSVVISVQCVLIIDCRFDFAPETVQKLLGG